MTEPNHSERAHSLLGGSTIERRIACPGSFALEDQVPEGPPSKYALEGTQAHELAESMLLVLKEQYEKDGSDGRSKDFWNAPGYENYPEDMKMHIKGYVNLIWDIVMEYKPKRILIEVHVVLSEKYDMHGSPDCFFAFKLDDKIVLFVMDLKYGQGKAVPADSPQLIFYALAIQEQFPKVEFDEFWLNIYQPRCPDEEEGAHKRHVLTKEEAKKWKKLILTTAEICHKQASKPLDNLTLAAGSHCGWCQGKPICPAYAGYLEKEAGMDFADDPSILVPAVADQRGELKQFTSDDRIAKILTYRKEIEKYISACEEYAINRCLEGNPIPGWKVVEGRSQRKWREEIAIVANGLAGLGIENPYTKKLKNLGTVETELKELGIKDPKAAIEPLVTKTIPGKTLAPDSDSRPAISVAGQAANDFNAIEEEDVNVKQTKQKGKTNGTNKNKNKK